VSGLRHRMPFEETLLSLPFEVGVAYPPEAERVESAKQCSLPD
jgi:hypothetical protein